MNLGKLLVVEKVTVTILKKLNLLPKAHHGFLSETALYRGRMAAQKVNWD